MLCLFNIVMQQKRDLFWTFWGNIYKRKNTLNGFKTEKDKPEDKEINLFSLWFLSGCPLLTFDLYYYTITLFLGEYKHYIIVLWLNLFILHIPACDDNI